MKNLKCDLPQERWDTVLGLFDNSLSLEEEQSIRAQFPQYLFFRNEFRDDGWNVSDPVRICTCTACGESFEAVRGNYSRGKLHNERCNCPRCGTEVTGKAVSKFSYGMNTLAAWIRTAVARPAGDGAVLISAGDAEMRYSHDDLTGDLSWYPRKRYYIGMDYLMEWERNWWYSDGLSGCAWLDKARYRETRNLHWTPWSPKKTVGEPFATQFQGYSIYDGSYQVVGLEEALEASALRYCKIREFYRACGAEIFNAPVRYSIRYLAQYTKHPQLEMTTRLHIEQEVWELLETGNMNRDYLNWKARTPAEFLRMSKQDTKAYLKWGLEFRDVREWKQIAGKLSLTKYMDYSSLLNVNGDGLKNLRIAADCANTAGIELSRAMKYIMKQTPRFLDGAGQNSVVAYWRDYLNMAQLLDYDLSEETVAMPRDLKERHDAAAETLKLKESAEALLRYKPIRKKLEAQFAFAEGEFCILVPKGSEEIVREGQTLRHCVGGYAARHMEGKTIILFMRKRRTPGRSFLTIELYTEKGKYKIRQIHGYRNENYTGGGKMPPAERYRWFLDMWLDWANAGSRRDSDGKPVLPKKYQNQQKEKTA